MSAAQTPITVYTRPGCPYCILLRRGLRRRRLTFTEVNIWEHPEAAAAVRAVADGNEIVPTVHVAGQWLVNPRAALVDQLAHATSAVARPSEAGQCQPTMTIGDDVCPGGAA